MKILILANRDLAANHALNYLLPELSKHHDVHLWLSARVGKASQARPAQLDELKSYEQDGFEKRVQALGDSTRGYSHFDKLSTMLSASIREVTNINEQGELNELKRLAPDLLISIRFGCILKRDALLVPSKGVLNLHSGILPDYRGVMATFWAMLNGERRIGTTLHFIDDASIDTGRIITVSARASDPKKSYLTQVLGLYPQGCRDILDTVEKLAADTQIDTCEQGVGGHYYTFPTQDEIAKFEQKGLKLVDAVEYEDFLTTYYL